MVQETRAGVVGRRSRKKVIVPVVAVLAFAAALLCAQLLLPQKLILEKVLVRLEQAAGGDQALRLLFGKRPDVEGFRCTILGTFRMEAFRSRGLTPDVLVEMDANQIRGRLSLFHLLGKRVKLSAEARELRAEVIPALGPAQQLSLRDARFGVVADSSGRTTRIEVSSPMARMGDLNGGRLEFRGVRDTGGFVVEVAELNLAPGSLSVEGKVTRGEFRYFDVKMQATGVRLGELGSISEFVDGTVSGEAEAKGELRSGLADGEATLRVIDGMVKERVVERFGELEALAVLALGDDGSRAGGGLPFRAMDVSLFANNAGVTLRSLDVSGEGYSLAGTGFASFTGRLSFLLRGQARGRGAASITVGGDIFSPDISWVRIDAAWEEGP